jgi:hypothetical protein
MITCDKPLIVPPISNKSTPRSTAAIWASVPDADT